LREVAPREPPVFSLSGQVYQQLGMDHEAYLCYNTAIDLDPREASNLKSALASLGQHDHDDDDNDSAEEEDWWAIVARPEQPCDGSV